MSVSFAPAGAVAAPPSGVPRPVPPAMARASVYRHLRLALGLSVVLVVGVGGWACLTEIAGAVIAPGQLVVESDVKKVQHPNGGVISELRVRDGSPVKAGDVLIRLDETQTRASLDIVLKALDELAARRAREEAERDGAAAIAFPGVARPRRGRPDGGEPDRGREAAVLGPHERARRAEGPAARTRGAASPGDRRTHNPGRRQGARDRPDQRRVEGRA